MKKIAGLLLGGFLFVSGVAQNYQKDFQTYFESNDSINQLRTLTAWEKANPNDPELFTSFFNYYFNKSRDEIIIISSEASPKEEKHLTFTDSAGNYAGYIGSKIKYDNSYLKKGLDKISNGIKLYPDRLDMRFGKIYALGQIKDWHPFTAEIILAIDHSAINNNEWTWTNNEKQRDGKDFFLSSLQDYQVQLYNTGKDDLLVNMREIANAVLKYYPDHIESLSNLSVTYLITGEYDKGIEALLKAEKINPGDYIVLSNIAQGYKMKGDKQKAIEYYEKTFEYGDKEAKAYAKQQIEELKK